VCLPFARQDSSRIETDQHHPLFTGEHVISRWHQHLLQRTPDWIGQSDMDHPYPRDALQSPQTPHGRMPMTGIIQDGSQVRRSVGKEEILRVDGDKRRAVTMDKASLAFLRGGSTLTPFERCGVCPTYALCLFVSSC
jgi:hypothetical protein